MEQSKGNIILYQTADGTTNIEVTLANDTVWLTADQMAELFQRDRSTIQRHIRSIYQDDELSQDSTCAFFAQVQKEGNRQVERNISIYNLDMIISVGYRVKSYRGVQFRIWATNVLREYLVKGFAMNDDLLKRGNTPRLPFYFRNGQGVISTAISKQQHRVRRHFSRQSRSEEYRPYS